MSNFPITREQFATWLDAKDGTETAGNTFSCFGCPLARAAGVGIGQNIWWYPGRENSPYSMPGWAIALVAAIDDLAPQADDQFEVSVAQVRKVLREV